MPKIILISGKARSGKDTFAMCLKNEMLLHGKRVLIIKYGDILKFVCKEYFNWNGEKDEVGRTLLQAIGTDLCRYNNPDTWVNCVVEIVKGLKSNYDYVLIPDVRFENEINNWWVTEFDSITIRMERINEDWSNYDNGLTKEQKIHPSETELDNYPFDCTIYNDSIIGLQNEAQAIFKKVEEW